MQVELFTDGSCWPQNGPGGWAFVLKWGELEFEKSGAVMGATNNTMELSAILEGLRALVVPCHVDIYSDSQYACNGFGKWRAGEPCWLGPGWVSSWKSCGWRTPRGPLKNAELWKALWVEGERHLSISTNWVRGHNGHVYNERCDELAGIARKSLSVDITAKPSKIRGRKRTAKNPKNTRKKHGN